MPSEFMRKDYSRHPREFIVQRQIRVGEDWLAGACLSRLPDERVVILSSSLVHHTHSCSSQAFPNRSLLYYSFDLALACSYQSLLIAS